MKSMRNCSETQLSILPQKFENQKLIMRKCIEGNKGIIIRQVTLNIIILHLCLLVYNTQQCA